MKRVYTVGHSTHPLDEFVELLRAHTVEQVVDVRTIPQSRHNPQFGHDALVESLAEQHIRYLWLDTLGGLRHTSKNSVNGAWRNTSFRGYADYMQTDAFTAGINELCTTAQEHVTTIMCAEAVPWRCHRSMIGDALLIRDYEVLDILSLTSVKAQTLTSFAKVDGLRIWYPPETVG
ncbi:DUF488 domain-containing protein [Rhodococcus qingshengii]|uniref:DUF488 domain-containing protein n=1 Tax=Rhodococcus qingshengii TaxID=334542 RepID=UPI001BEB9244|nr:DUF488 domain-containing protein [Rhodococcus qingshengii]MBT2275670.1 DUF488 domain-containing protein [Rhodococcus qingshengii]